MNSNWYPLLIAAAYLIIHVVSAIAKESQRRKDRAAKEANRRKAQGQLDPVTVATPPASPDPMFGLRVDVPKGGTDPVPTPARTGRSLDDLAARRKEQLDLLRGRQESRRLGQPVPTRTSTAPPTMTPGRGGGEPLFRGPVTSQSPGEFRANQERERREREEAKARRERQQRAIQRREVQTKARLDLARHTAEQLLQPEPDQPAQAVERQQRTAATAETGRTGQLANLFTQTLRKQGALRELIILKEVIDPPLALRDAAP